MLNTNHVNLTNNLEKMTHFFFFFIPLCLNIPSSKSHLLKVLLALYFGPGSKLKQINLKPIKYLIINLSIVSCLRETFNNCSRNHVPIKNYLCIHAVCGVHPQTRYIHLFKTRTTALFR